MDALNSIPDLNNTDQKQRADELALSLNRHVLERQKLVNVLEHEFGQISGWGTDESPEDAATRLLRAQAKTIAELREDLSEAEAESARFSKQNRLMSVRSTELIAEVKALKTPCAQLVASEVKVNMSQDEDWHPPYQSIKVTRVDHWLGKIVVWPSKVNLTEPDALSRCITVLCPVYDVMIHRIKSSGDLHIFVDDFGGGFRTR